MAYVFLPPRTTNFFPAGPPYLSGLYGLGLGDYAADLAAYKHTMALYEAAYKAWVAKKKKYDAAMVDYDAQVKNIDASYAADLATYKKNYAIYLLAVAAYANQVNSIKKANTARAQTINSSYGLNLPQSFFDNGACLTQAQHDSYSCHTVKGLLGVGLGGADPGCGYRALPICAFPARPVLPAYPPSPVYPKKPKLAAAPAAPTIKAPTPPPTPMAPVPVAPTAPAAPAAPVPVDVTTPDVTPESPAPPKQANMVRNGLLLVAVLGGGYLVYRTLKKPKAA